MSQPGNRTVNKEDYQKYIKSSAWRAKRKRFFDSKLDKSCYICGDKNSPKDLHHRTYKNLGNERLMDLVPTCSGSCHQAIHDLQGEQGLDIWSATTKLRKMFKRTGSIRSTSEVTYTKKKYEQISDTEIKEAATQVNEQRKKRAVRKLRKVNKKKLAVV